jgi:response regulator RpfG family c-di-GMP phosphodiesterase
MAEGKILLAGVQPDIIEFLSKLPEAAFFTILKDYSELENAFETYADGMFYLIFIGGALTNEQALEAGQFLSCQCPATPVFFLINDKTRLSTKKFIKNGYKEVFVTPMDNELMINAIHKNVSSDKLKARSYRTVKAVDIQGNSELNFDTYVFLPLNGKYVKYTRADTKISNEKVEKLSKFSVSNIFLDQKDMEKFYEYSANALTLRTDSTNPMSATEREEVLQGSIRKLFVNLLDASEESSYDEGKVYLSVCQNIVSKYLTNGKSSSWYKDLVRSIGSGSAGYNRASSISTIASLFAIGINLENISDIAIAGFLCDVSLSDFPEEYLEMKVSDMPEDIRLKYTQHPLNSVNLIKEKKMIVTPICEKAIMQHHEDFSGRGFPKAIGGHKICIEAQMIRLAEQFYDLTRIRPGFQKFTPEMALNEINKNGTIDFETISRVKKLVPKT